MIQLLSVLLLSVIHLMIALKSEFRLDKGKWEEESPFQSEWKGLEGGVDLRASER